MRRYLSGGELQPLRGFPGGQIRDGDLPEAESLIVVLVLLLVLVEGVAAEPRGLKGRLEMMQSSLPIPRSLRMAGSSWASP